MAMLWWRRMEPDQKQQFPRYHSDGQVYVIQTGIKGVFCIKTMAFITYHVRILALVRCCLLQNKCIYQTDALINLTSSYLKRSIIVQFQLISKQVAKKVYNLHGYMRHGLVNEFKFLVLNKLRSKYQISIHKMFGKYFFTSNHPRLRGRAHVKCGY